MKLRPTSSAPPAPDEPTEGLLPDDTIEAADTIRMPGPLHRVYRFFISKRTGIGLILSMAVLTLLGTMLVQSTADQREDPQLYAEWLDTVRPKYQGWTDILDWLGLFDVFGSWYFKAVNIALCISILCCVVHRIPLLWKRATRPQLHVTEPFFAHAGIHHDLTAPVPPEQAETRVRAALSAARYRVLDDPKGPGRNTYADKFRWMPFGTIMAHIAFVIILLGCLITANTGFSVASLPVTVGTRTDVGHGTGLSIEATSFEDAYYDDGRPKDYVSHLVLYQDGVKVKEQDTRVNEPLRYDGVKVFQAAFGFAAKVSVKDRTGTVIYQGGVPLKVSTPDGEHVYGKVAVPGRDVDLFVVTSASGKVDPELGPGAAVIRIMPTDKDENLGEQVVTQGQSATIRGLTYTFEREAQYTDLMVSDDPGALWVWIGSGMILVGMTVTMFLRHRRLWVRVVPAEGGSRIRIASSERHDTAYEAWVARLVEGIAADLGATPTSAASGPDRAARHSTVGA
ncbi:cytochrome c biogenesis protein ResB [Arsenicicoccus dermatophilus]|uniref:cytochrome c biogenesis protein ResB n=1 Tax=Arsenicicoccus dermatophilus TaxID=1076331 RepID=UPI00391710A3